MTMPEGWAPIRIHWSEAGLRVNWAFIGNQRFTDPFFAQTVEKCLRRPAQLLFQRETSLEALIELGQQRPSLPVRGFIFHSSRCGSTLITQMLAAMPENVVISEAAPIDVVLRSHFQDLTISDDQRIRWLRALLNTLGQRRLAEEKSLFVKFDSWHALLLPLIRRAFPDVPWIFVYREPLETLQSHSRQRGGHVIPGVLEPALYGWDAETVNQMSSGEYGARALARIYLAGLESAQAAPNARVINYRQLPGIVWPELTRFWGLDLGASIPEPMARACGRDAKNPSLPFIGRPTAANRGLSDPLFHLARQWMNETYQALEAHRLSEH